MSSLVAPAVGGGILALAFHHLRPKPRTDSLTEREFGTVTYEVGGPEDASAVVFTHGFALDRGTWREQVATHSESYRVLSWDLPGCGEAARSSDPVRFEAASRKLIDVLVEEGIDQAVLVGQSMGSLLNQYVAHHHPDRVRALVHVGGFPLREGFSELVIGLIRVHLRVLNLVPDRLLYDVFGRLVARTPDAKKYVTRASARTGKVNMISLERGLVEDIDQGILNPIEVPQVVVVGEHEWFLLRKKAREWSERHPGTVYRTVPDAGHVANHDKPTAFNEILSSFLKSLD